MSMPAERLQNAHDLQVILEGIANAPSVPVSRIVADSRQLRAGDLFVALGGGTYHGLDFMDQAIRANVAAVIWDASTGDAAAADGPMPIVAVPHLQQRLGEIANRWYGAPSHALDVAGVTGTNGKTTVAYLAAQCLTQLGRSCGYLGTLGRGIETLNTENSLTTPACLDVHAALAEFRDSGAVHAAMEVSSHALSQERLDGVRLNAALFTNLSRDHIDYHGGMREYGAAKARLFTDFDPEHQIVNVDCDFGATLIERVGPDAVSTSIRVDRKINGHPFVFARALRPHPRGTAVTVTSSWGNGDLDVPLTGDFNVSNALQVFALLLCWGVDFDEARALLATAQAPAGRMQSIRHGLKSPQVIIDYAHTPAALEAALRALRPHIEGKIWCVFGCGGDRDRGKRAEMGAAADRFADVAVVTSDNPRTEPPYAIIEDVLAGMSDGTTAIEDRALAIAHAVLQADENDAVLIAGKGHEPYQIIGTERREFSDEQVARAELDKRSFEVER